MEEQNTGCVLFADVSGSTKLYESVGDAAAHSAIDLCVKLFRALTEQHGGRVVKTIGDEVMAIFAETPNAGKAAVDIQLGVNDMAPIEKVQLGVRIGLHHGPIVERDGDVFGDTVNLAARLTEMASKGQIITSLETVELLDPIQKMDCRRLYSIPVKGKEREVEICELMWSDSEDATQLVAHRATTDAGDALRLVYRGRVVIVSPERRVVVLGRDASADLVVPDRMASRTHCEIEQRQDKFVLADRSANGTYLCIDGDREIVLRREEALLRGHGFVTLGQSRATATEFVEFFCEQPGIRRRKMGIKDWFGGDKKKAAYRDKLKEAVADGKLDTQEMKSLEELRKELEVGEAAGDRTVIRREIYNEAVGAAKREGEFTTEDAADLAKIQKFLALRDDQVERTKWDLARLRVLTEIRQGNLPTVSPSNVALRGVQFEPDEIAHYSVSVEVSDQPSTRGADGVQMVWGKPYDGGSARAHVVPETGAKPLGEGSLIITDRRLILKTGNRTAAVKYGREAQIYLYGDGVRMPRTVGNMLLKFRSGSEETGEIVGELLSALMK